MSESAVDVDGISHVAYLLQLAATEGHRNAVFIQGDHDRTEAVDCHFQVAVGCETGSGGDRTQVAPGVLSLRQRTRPFPVKPQD